MTGLASFLAMPLVWVIFVEGVRMTVIGPFTVRALIVLPLIEMTTASVLTCSARTAVEMQRVAARTARPSLLIVIAIIPLKAQA